MEQHAATPVVTPSIENAPAENPEHLARLAESAWWESSALRLAAHRQAGMSGCPTRHAPYAARDAAGAAANRVCEAHGCLDVFHEVLLGCLEKLAGGIPERVEDVNRYLRRVVANEVADLERRARVRRGGPAKPTRTDGVPGRVIAAIQRETGDESEWLIAVFRMVRSYPHRPGSLATAWPLDGWTAEKSAHDGRMRVLGTASARTEIRGDIDRVLAIATREAGAPWVHDNILGALMGTHLLSEAEPAAPGNIEDRAVCRLIARDYRRNLGRGADSPAALRAATRHHLGVEPAASAVADCVDLLEPAGVAAR